jgi:hypothetical protein
MRRLEAVLEMLGPDDPILDQLAELAERRLIERGVEELGRTG